MFLQASDTTKAGVERLCSQIPEWRQFQIHAAILLGASQNWRYYTNHLEKTFSKFVRTHISVFTSYANCNSAWSLCLRQSERSSYRRRAQRGFLRCTKFADVDGEATSIISYSHVKHEVWQSIWAHCKAGLNRLATPGFNVNMGIWRLRC